MVEQSPHGRVVEYAPVTQSGSISQQKFIKFIGMLAQLMFAACAVLVVMSCIGVMQERGTLLATVNFETVRVQGEIARLTRMSEGSQPRIKALNDELRSLELQREMVRDLQRSGFSSVSPAFIREYAKAEIAIESERDRIKAEGRPSSTTYGPAPSSSNGTIIGSGPVDPVRNLMSQQDFILNSSNNELKIFSYFSDEILLFISTMLSCALGSFAAGLRNHRTSSVQDVMLGFISGLFTVLSLKGGKAFLLQQDTDFFAKLDPYSIAFAAVVVGLFTERVYSLLARVFSSVEERVEGAFQLKVEEKSTTVTAQSPPLQGAAPINTSALLEEDRPKSNSPRRNRRGSPPQ